MKRVLLFTAVLLLMSGTVSSQEASLPGLFDPETFRESVDVRSSLATLTRAVDDPQAWETLSQRILVLDGVVSSLAVYVDEEDEYYAEIELVAGAWQGVERVEIYRAWVVLDDPVFAGLLTERPPRDPDPNLIVRNNRVLLAARLVDLFVEEDGTAVPVLVAYDIRNVR